MPVEHRRFPGAPAQDRSRNCASRFLAPGFWSISAPEIPRIA